MAGNTVTLEFAGDAKKLQNASKDATRAVTDVGAAASTASADLNTAGQDSGRFADRVGNLGAAVSGATDAIDSMGGAAQAVADIQDYARAKAQRLARANIDVMQATEDMAQATRDASQAGIDAEQAAVDLTQARLDQKTAQEDYNKAVAEHGEKSNEARQAMLDMRQAGIDVKQAQEDQAQATRDASQANIDAKGAQVDLNDAMHEAKPPELQDWADKISMVTPLLSAAVGVLGLVTAAQWAWNAAQLASPLTWIVLAVAAVIAIIVLLATKTEWGRKAWAESWAAIKNAAAAVGRWFRDTLWGSWIKGSWEKIVNGGKSVWEWMKALPGKLKDQFAKVKDFIFAPFRSAFNAISAAWNATIGSLSWTVPGWVPGVGGNTISVPNLPTFHQGGTVPGPPGADVLIRAQAGEEVRTRASQVGGTGFVPIRGDAAWDALVDVIATAVGRRGGDPAELGIR